MKSKKLAVSLATLATAGAMLVGCKDKKGVSVESVAIKGVSLSYSVEDTINWDELTVSVTYSDKTVTSFTKVQFDVETTAEDTECIVMTSGLHDMEVLEIGSYDIKVALKEDFTKFYDAGKIVVGAEISSTNYELIEFSAPNFVTSYLENTKTANFTDETSFVETDEMFTVGTLNEFKFIPNASFDSKDGTEVDVISNKYLKDVTLKEVNEATTVEASQADYSLTADGVKFNESAIGKHFEISVMPKDEGFKKTFDGADVKPVKFTFKVEKGLNIYEAKQLGALNLSSITPLENNGDAYFYYLYSEDENGNQTSCGQYDVFWNKNKEKYTHVDTVKLWKEFLVNTGTFVAAELEKLQDLPAIFLMNDIDIKPSDIPAEYFVTLDEPGNTIGQAGVGCLRDSAALYNMPLNVSRNINGNYFNLDTNDIPLCKNTVSPFRTWTDKDPQIFPGQASVFYFGGLCFRNESEDDEYRANQVMDERVGQAVTKNIRTKGNTTNDMQGGDLEKRLKITGLMFVKGGYGDTLSQNLVIREYTIGVFANENMGQANPAKGIAQKDHSFVKNCKIFDCSNSGLFNYENGGLNVSKTMLKRFGGAPIITIGSDNNPLWQGNTKFSSDCILENKITGQEVYFSALGASAAVVTLKQLNAAFEPLQTPFVASDGTMNVLSLTMDGNYISSSKKTNYSSTTLFADSDTPYEQNLNDMTKPLSQVYAGTSYQAPSCCTEKGDIFYFGGSYLCNIDGSMKTTPVDGNYMTMFAPAGETTLNIIFGMK